MTKEVNERKVILFIAASLDGYIAKPNDDLSFLSIVEQEGEDYGYTEFTKTVDTVILGRKTYDWVMKQVPAFPRADKETYIITRTARPDKGKIIFYKGEMKELVLKLKAAKGKNIRIGTRLWRVGWRFEGDGRFGHGSDRGRASSAG